MRDEWLGLNYVAKIIIGNKASDIINGINIICPIYSDIFTCLLHSIKITHPSSAALLFPETTITISPLAIPSC